MFGDVVQVSGTGSASFTNPTAQPNKAVTVSGFGLSGVGAGNYTLTQPAGLIADVAPSAQTVTFGSLTGKVYGEPPIQLTPETTSGLPVSLTVVGGSASIRGGTLTVLAAGTITVRASQDGTINYLPAEAVEQSFVVTPRPVSVIGLAAVNRPYDATTQAPLVGTAALAVGSILLDDDVVLSGTAIGTFDSGTVGAVKPVTVSGLSLTGAKASSYELMPVTGFVADITTRFVNVVNVLAQDKVYDGQLSVALVGEATPVGLVEGDAVTFVPKSVGMLEDPNAGASKLVFTDYQLTGPSAPNYTLLQPDYVKASVTPKELTISGLSAVSRIFNNTAGVA
ncbi:MAG: hypothetical protein EBR81_18060, partial [Proteobacteria bacterium]|nr:hypothetical protein [Pseudomonadota bacterium]